MPTRPTGGCPPQVGRTGLIIIATPSLSGEVDKAECESIMPATLNGIPDSHTMSSIGL